MGISENAEIAAFKHEEDDEFYDVWEIKLSSGCYVLKKATVRELSVYSSFLKPCKLNL